ncbi:LysM peptidoglycan-binding domain-containing protein [Desulfobulbus alkaliphilus]|uniref:LysM peptidoglycan-binding domain-containing protein n=1 Tax=Desulfobulbus alkaliphilus TaxID=869814 RepID=UPI0019660D38|nr:LysM domain-containing protein [Desulfobulbus alkaliphilus]MBM9537098.1 LysM peptidoglycan-binding domain-containing protein [Desulfobulbus alkaliphilus]
MVTATTIRETLQAGRLIEAGTLLVMAGETLSAEERRQLDQEIEQIRGKAEVLLAEADQLEQAGHIEEARRRYGAVQAMAVDFPGIAEHVKRLDDSLFLARAVRHRSRRVRSTMPGAAPIAPIAPKKKRLPIWALGLGGVVVATMFFVLLPDRARIGQEPRETASPPASERSEVAPAAAIEPVLAAPSGQEAAPVPLAQPVEPAEPEATPQPSGDPAPVVAHQVVEEPLPAPEPEPTELAGTGESTPPEPDLVAPAAGEADTADTAADTDVADVADVTDTQAPEETIFLYTVQPGDTLGAIAAAQLCRFWAWRDIYEQNRDVITDPDHLNVGTELRLDQRDSHCPSN